MDSHEPRRRSTLIPAMVVIVPYLIFAAWRGLSAYEEYQARQTAIQVHSVLAQCHAKMVERYSVTGKGFAAGSAPSDCGLPNSTDHAEDITVSDKRIATTMRGIHPELDGSRLYIEAVFDQRTGNLLDWHCGTNADPHAFRLLPSNCRNP